MSNTGNETKGLLLTNGPSYEQMEALHRLLKTCPPQGESNPTAHVTFTVTKNGEVARIAGGFVPRLKLRLIEIDATLPRKDMIVKGIVVEPYRGGALIVGTTDFSEVGAKVEMRYSCLSCSGEVTAVAPAQ